MMPRKNLFGEIDKRIVLNTLTRLLDRLLQLFTPYDLSLYWFSDVWILY